MVIIGGTRIFAQRMDSSWKTLFFSALILFECFFFPMIRFQFHPATVSRFVSSNNHDYRHTVHVQKRKKKKLKEQKEEKRRGYVTDRAATGQGKTKM